MPDLPRCIPRNLDEWIEFACAYVISLFVLLLLWGFLEPRLSGITIAPEVCDTIEHPDALNVIL